jgi:putative dehydrogenase
MESKFVGMIGLGIMGSAMSASLIRAGFKVVGYDVLPRRRQDHRKAGGTAARSCREVARLSDILVTSLPSSETLLDTAAELAKSARAHQIVIETSTLPIPVKEEARKRLAARGVILLDCTLSGTGAQARVKDLVVYASGDRKSYRRVSAVLDGFARAHYYVGEFSAGSKMKFVANLLVAIHSVAAAEAMVLAIEIGARPGADFESGLRWRGKLAHASGARPHDGEGSLLRLDDESADLAEGHDHHRRLRAKARLSYAAIFSQRAVLYRCDGHGAGRG